MWRGKENLQIPLWLQVLYERLRLVCSGSSQRQKLTEGMPRCPRATVSTTSQSTTLLLLPPAAAIIRLSLCGWNLTCQVSDGGVSITAFVLLSCIQSQATISEGTPPRQSQNKAGHQQE